MIRANELRLGNKIDIYGSVGTIVPYDFEKHCNKNGIFE